MAAIFDGVLADFNSRFINRVIHVTGRDLFPPRPFEIPVWDYPEHYGYTQQETSRTWDSTLNDDTFWQNLDAYPDVTETLKRLFSIQNVGNDVYFITSRLGIKSKVQTQRWLRRHGFPEPTVLISGDKGGCARALKLDAYIDDRWENVVAVRSYSKDTRVFLIDQAWNRVYTAEDFGIVRVQSSLEFVSRL